MRPALRRIALASSVLLPMGAATIAWKLAPRPTPDQAPLASLDEKTFGELRDAFNASADRTRVLAILSPT
jgi:hypothetical protein